MYKKLIAVVLTLAMVLCTWAPAFADTMSENEPPAETAADFTAEPGEDPDADAESEGEESEEAESEEAESEEAESEEAESEEEDSKEEDSEEAAKESAKAKAARLKAEKYRNGLAAYIRRVNPALGKKSSRRLAQTFIDAGKKYKVDEKILMALAQRESSFNAKITSPYGYKGMMQTSDALARKYGYKACSLYKAEVSIDVAARYLGGMKKEFGTYTKALSGYVYGGYAVQKGLHSTAAANAMLKTRREIKAYLKKNKFI